MKKVLLKIGGMTCSACSSGLEKFLNRQDGIESASVNLVMNNANIQYDEEKLNLEQIEKFGYSNLPVCIAKTQYSFSDDPKNLECLEPFKIHVQDIILKAGAEFIVVITGKIMTMPGLPKIPAAEQIDIDNDGNIVGIF